MFDEADDNVRELDASELAHVCGAAFESARGTDRGTPGGTADGVTAFGSKPGSTTDGVTLLGSKPGAVGDGRV